MGKLRQVVITNKGEALLTKLVGSMSHFMPYVVKTSNFSPSVFTNLKEITELTDIRKTSYDVTIELMQSEVNELYLRVKAKILNPSNSGYFLDSFGLFVSDPDEGEILFAIGVIDTPDYINSNATDFLHMNFIIALDTINSKNYNIIPAGILSPIELNNRIELFNYNLDFIETDVTNIEQNYVKKSDVPDISGWISEHNNATIGTHNTIRNNIDSATHIAQDAYNIANEAAAAIAFPNFAQAITDLNNRQMGSLKAGDAILILQQNRPDLWVHESLSTFKGYNFTTDEAFLNDLAANQYVQVGYWMIAESDSQKVDIDGEFVPLTRRIENISLATNLTGIKARGHTVYKDSGSSVNRIIDIGDRLNGVTLNRIEDINNIIFNIQSNFAYSSGQSISLTIARFNVPKPIKFYENNEWSESTTDRTWSFGVYSVFYDSTVGYFKMIQRNIQKGNTIYAGIVQLNRALESTSITEAATLDSVRTVYNIGNSIIVDEIGSIPSRVNSINSKLESLAIYGNHPIQSVATNIINTNPTIRRSGNIYLANNSVSDIQLNFYPSEFGVIVPKGNSSIAFRQSSFIEDAYFPRPDASSNDCSFSPDGTYLAISSRSAAYNISVCKKIGLHTYSSIFRANPNTINNNAAYGCSFSSDGVYLAVTSVYTNLSIYKRNGDTFIPLSGLPALPGSSEDCAFSRNDIVAIAHTNPPYVTLFKRNGDTFSTLNVNLNIPANGSNCCFSKDGNYLAVTYIDNKGFSLYKRDRDNFIQITTPSLNTTGADCAFSDDGVYLAIGMNVSPFLKIFKRKGKNYENLPAANVSLINGRATGIAFSHNGLYLAVQHNTSPYFTMFRRFNDRFIRISHPITVPNYGEGCAFSPDDTELVLPHAAAPFVTFAKKDTGIVWVNDDYTVTDSTKDEFFVFHSVGDNQYVGDRAYVY